MDRPRDVAEVGTPTSVHLDWLAEQIAAADGGHCSGFPTIMPSKPPLLSFGVRVRHEVVAVTVMHLE
jgi:hypothetical protein